MFARGGPSAFALLAARPRPALLARVVGRARQAAAMAQLFLAEAEAGGPRAPAELRALAERWVQRQFPGVARLGTEALQRWLAERADELLLLDTRTPPEFETSHLPGSVLLAPEPDALPDLFKTWLEQERKGHRRHVICYCTVGYRSSLTAQLLEGLLSREAFATSSKFYNLQGGLVKWAAERRPMVDQRGEPTHLVHPYSPTWARLLEPELQAEM